MDDNGRKRQAGSLEKAPPPKRTRQTSVRSRTTPDERRRSPSEGSVATLPPTPGSQDALRVVVPRNDFRHTPLDSTASEIRLIRILPRQGPDQAIHCESFHISLDDSPAYTCLSYVWGHGSDTQLIYIDGRRFFVRFNLWQILNRISRNQGFRGGAVFWADAICINQQDNQERNHQVQLMGKIFSSAEEVVAWLGEEDEDSQQAFDLIQRLLRPGAMTARNGNWMHDYGFVGLAQLLTRPWWSRSWMAQEVLLAKKATIVSGSSSVDFGHIADALEMFRFRSEAIKAAFRSDPRHSGHLDKLETLDNSSAARLIKYRDSTRRKGDAGGTFLPSLTLESLVDSFSYSKCSNPRDRVYALLGLAKSANPSRSSDIEAHARNERELSVFTAARPSIQVEYSRSTLSVYTDFVRHCIETSRSLDVICRPWADLRRQKWRRGVVDPDLQVQVPSWIALTDELPFRTRDGEGTVRVRGDPFVGKPEKQPYNASFNREARVRYGSDATGDEFDGTICARGLHIATITTCSTRMGDGIVHAESWEMIESQAVPEVSGHLTSHTDLLWRILTGDRDPDGERAARCYRFGMNDLRKEEPNLSAIDTVMLLEKYRESSRAPHIVKLLERIQSVVWDRKIVQARRCTWLEIGDNSKPLVGITSKRAEPGDIVVILLGGSTPMMLRPHCVMSETCYELLGDAYIHGVMDGQVFDPSLRSQTQVDEQLQNFEIC